MSPVFFDGAQQAPTEISRYQITFPSSPRFSGSPTWYSANLMLDEPPLIVRMLG
jgi:hypothetical protein